MGLPKIADPVGPPVFCELPPDGRTEKRKWYPLLEVLVERPGEWARLAILPEKQAYTLRGSLQAGAKGERARLVVPPGRWSFATRKYGQHRAVYACYEGSEPPSAQT